MSESKVYSIIPVLTELDGVAHGFTELDDATEGKLRKMDARILGEIRSDAPVGTRFIVVPSPEMGSWADQIDRLSRLGEITVVDDAIDFIA